MGYISIMQKDKILLIIAHRMATIKSCDFFYRVESGAITPERIGTVRHMHCLRLRQRFH